MQKSQRPEHGESPLAFRRRGMVLYTGVVRGKELRTQPLVIIILRLAMHGEHFKENFSWRT
jgi:hypothetical protein